MWSLLTTPQHINTNQTHNNWMGIRAQVSQLFLIIITNIKDTWVSKMKLLKRELMFSIIDKATTNMITQTMGHKDILNSKVNLAQERAQWIKTPFLVATWMTLVTNKI